MLADVVECRCGRYSFISFQKNNRTGTRTQAWSHCEKSRGCALDICSVANVKKKQIVSERHGLSVFEGRPIRHAHTAIRSRHKL